MHPPGSLDLPAGQLSNDGRGKLRTPGFDSLPISARMALKERFNHGSDATVQEPNITARELAMLQLMDHLTDIQDWHGKVFSDDIVSEWRRDACNLSLINNAAWDWCIAELRDKANSSKLTGRTVVFNAGAGVCKSDVAVPVELRQELAQLVQLMVASTERQQESYSGSNDGLFNIVDPSLFPLVYGRTKILCGGEKVDLQSPFSYCDRGIIAPSHGVDWLDNGNVTSAPEWHPDGYSMTFQWLPCEVEFTNETATSVRITSYINNLHPVHYQELYHTIERVISCAIEPWNEILAKGEDQRYPVRIKTWGVEWYPETKEWKDLAWIKDPTLLQDPTTGMQAMQYVNDYLALPEDVPVGHVQQEDGTHDLSKQIPNDWQKRNEFQSTLLAKWNRRRYWRHPSPGESYTFEQWKQVKTVDAIIPRVKINRGMGIQPETEHNYYTVSLQREFSKSGLQIIVKLSNIELSPSNPAYIGGSCVLTEWATNTLLQPLCITILCPI